MRLWMFVLMLAAGACGTRQDLVAQNAARPGFAATGTLMIAAASFCSATLVAPDVVVTSGRCARAAIAQEGSWFRVRQGVAVWDSAVRAGHVPDHAGALTTPGVRWRPAHRTRADRAAARAVQRRCHVADMFALRCTPASRTCLDRIPAPLLAQAGALGLAAWDDIGWLGLEDALPVAPAVPARAPWVLTGAADLWRVGTTPWRRGPRAPTARRYEHAYQLYEADASELHAGPQSGPAWDDMGSALWLDTLTPGDRRMQLVGVGSRPFVAHGDTSAGVIFTLVAPFADLADEAVAHLTRIKHR